MMISYMYLQYGVSSFFKFIQGDIHIGGRGEMVNLFIDFGVGGGVF